MKVKAYWWITFFFMYVAIISIIMVFSLSSSFVAFLFSEGGLEYRSLFGVIFFVSLILFVSAVLTSATMEVLDHYSKR